MPTASPISPISRLTVGVDHVVNVLELDVASLLGTHGTAGIVHKHVKALDALGLESRDKSVDSPAVGDVQSLDKDADLDAKLLGRGETLRLDLLEGLEAASEQDEVGTRLGEQDSSGGADTARGTSDDSCRRC